MLVVKHYAADRLSIAPVRTLLIDSAEIESGVAPNGHTRVMASDQSERTGDRHQA